jgi:hypothetical protein
MAHLVIALYCSPILPLSVNLRRLLDCPTMRNQCQLLGLNINVVAVGVLLCSVSPLLSAEPEPAKQAEWIDESILRQLQAISPIDRSKLTHAALQAIVQHTRGMIDDVTVVVSAIGVEAPELTAEDSKQKVFVIKGKTKQPFQVRNKLFPPGLPTKLVYSEAGRLLYQRTSMPPPKLGQK